MDKLLNAVKDFSAIKRYLEAINQTTDDFLYMYDIPNDAIQFFGNIRNTFKINDSDVSTRSIEEILTIVHPADRNRLMSDILKIRNGKKDSHDMDFRMFNVKGETVWVNSRAKVLHDEKGAPYVLLGRLSEEALRHLFNPLTGLWNKTKLREDMVKRLKGGKGWLMLLGIPSLASINLTHGRNFGNQLLCEIADLLEEIDFVEESYHVDNNNFAVVTGECDGKTVEAIYGRVLDAIGEKCTVSAGAVPIDNCIFGNVSQLIDSANITLQNSMKDMMGALTFFSAEEIEKRIAEQTLLEELKESVQNSFEGFEVYYQPQIKRENYELYGVEALLRYRSKNGNMVFPDEFIPILEQSGLISPVGMWVLEQALAQCKIWRESMPSLQVSVNFSSMQFEDHRLGDKIIDALKAAELPGNALTVELTESVQLGINKQNSNLIKYLKSHGIRFAMDDFGTGYSSLSYLKDLDVNEIKIDRCFVTDIEKDTYNYRLIYNVLEFAKENDIFACCEGVETAKELSILEDLQPDFFQGYLFDRPCRAEEIERKYIHDSSEEYKARMEALEVIHCFMEQYGGIYFDPKNILHENDIGLWIIRISKNGNAYELYVDEVMKHVLGLGEKLSPSECYDYWYSRIVKDDIECVDNAFSTMINGGKAVQMEYRWIHPTLGEVAVRSSGIRTYDKRGAVKLEGYHRILTGVEGV